MWPGRSPSRRRISFSAKFALIILVAGLAIAVIPLAVARHEAQRQAAGRAADKAGLAANLIAGERQSLQSFIGAVALQLDEPPDGSSNDASVLGVLLRDSQANGGADVLGVLVDARTTLLVQRGAPLADATTAGILRGAVQAHAATLTDARGQPWMVETAAGGTATALIARPLDAAYLGVLRSSVVTSGDPADLAVARNGHWTGPGTIAGVAVRPGAAVDASLTPLLRDGGAAVIAVGGHDVAVAVTPLGGGVTLVVSTSAGGLASFWEPALLLVAVILVAMLFIIVIVQTDLQRPLSRLDRAVAALGRGDLDVEIPIGRQSEIGRLGHSFEVMRQEMRATIHSNAARAAIAYELNAPQPLETALRRVAADLRSSTGAAAGLIVVGGTEVTDSFVVAAGLTRASVDAEAILNGEGPVGIVARQQHVGSVQLGAAIASPEAQHGLRDICAAPIRLGGRGLGVVAIADRAGGFLSAQRDLVETAAEQVALALERNRFLAMVQRQASIDDLTGLHNHRFMVDYLRQQIALAERQDTPLAVLMLDLDHFKDLNDRYGHHVGDEALRGFAGTLLASVRRADLAARYGGEEFVVVMANTGRKEALLVAEKVRAAVAAAVIPAEGLAEPLRISVSIGGAAYPDDTTSARMLLLLADRALYAAKRGGRNRVLMADPDMVTGTDRQVEGLAQERRKQDAFGGQRRSPQ